MGHVALLHHKSRSQIKTTMTHGFSEPPPGPAMPSMTPDPPTRLDDPTAAFPAIPCDPQGADATQVTILCLDNQVEPS